MDEALTWWNNLDDNQIKYILSKYDLKDYIKKEKISELYRSEIKPIKPRFILDIRNGISAVRDTHHPDYDETYQGLHPDTLDVVQYRMGFWSGSDWAMYDSDVEYLTNYCNEINRRS